MESVCSSDWYCKVSLDLERWPLKVLVFSSDSIRTTGWLSMELVLVRYYFLSFHVCMIMKAV